MCVRYCMFAILCVYVCVVLFGGQEKKKTHLDTYSECEVHGAFAYAIIAIKPVDTQHYTDRKSVV